MTLACANPTGRTIRYKPPTTTPAGVKVRTLLEPLQVSGKFVPFLLLVSLLKQKQTKTLDLYYVFVECLRSLTFKFAFLQEKTFHRFNTLTWFVLYLYFTLFFWFSICFNSARFMQLYNRVLPSHSFRQHLLRLVFLQRCSVCFDCGPVTVLYSPICGV